MSEPSSIFTARFWKGCGERAAKTLAQSILSLSLATIDAQTVPAGRDMIAAANALTGSTPLSILYAALLTTAFSVLTSIGTADFVAGDKGAPAEDIAATLANELQAAGATITPTPEPGTIPARET